jgi:hypothetical protein
MTLTVLSAFGGDVDHLPSGGGCTPSGSSPTFTGSDDVTIGHVDRADLTGVLVRGE